MADVYMKNTVTGDIRVAEKDSPEFYRLQAEKTTANDAGMTYPKYEQTGSHVAIAAGVYDGEDEFSEFITSNIPASTILADYDQVVGEAPFAGRVVHVGFTPEAAITGANSPASRTYTLVNKGQAGAGTTVVATLAMTSGVNGVAFDEKTITLSAVAGATTVVEGDELAWISTAVGGTGLVDPGGQVEVEIARGTAA